MLCATVMAKAPTPYARSPSTYARLRPMRSPTLLLMRMNAADTSASSAIADCTPLAVVFRSGITAEIETFMSDVSTTRTNIAAAKRTANCVLPLFSDPPRSDAPALVLKISLSRQSPGTRVRPAPWQGGQHAADPASKRFWPNDGSDNGPEGPNRGVRGHVARRSAGRTHRGAGRRSDAWSAPDPLGLRHPACRDGVTIHPRKWRRLVLERAHGGEPCDRGRRRGRGPWPPTRR